MFASILVSMQTTKFDAVVAMDYGLKRLDDKSRCLRDLEHQGNRNRRPGAARSGRLYNVHRFLRCSKSRRHLDSSSNLYVGYT